MILAGTNFNLLYLTMTRKRGLAALLRDEENRFYLAIIGVATLLVFAANQVFSHFQDPLRSLLDSAFQIVSIITTTGYMTAGLRPLADLFEDGPPVSVLFGGSSSSTSGGVKCVRVLICLEADPQEFFSAPASETGSCRSRSTTQSCRPRLSSKSRTSS